MKHPRHWKPLEELPLEAFPQDNPKVVATIMSHYGMTEEAARAWLQEDHNKSRYFVNNLYQVQAAPCGYGGKWLHLNIRRRDGSMFKDWRHFQEIKNQIAGPEREAVELYPAESRKVDTSNKWHLWVMPEGASADIGWMHRDISYDENRDVPGMRQRAL